MKWPSAFRTFSLEGLVLCLEGSRVWGLPVQGCVFGRVRV